jgi:ketosteroid isomerase-like protein
MSEASTGSDHEDKLRQSTEAFARGDAASAVTLYAERPVFDMSSVGVGMFEGQDAIRTLLEDWVEAYEDYAAEMVEHLELGNEVTFSVLLHRGRLAGGSQFIELRHSYTVTWANGLAERITVRPDIDEARADAERLAAERGSAVRKASATPNLEKALRRSMEAFNRRDFDAAMTLYTPDAVWDTSIVAFDVYDGLEAIRSFLEEWRGTYDEFEQVLEEFHDLGNGVTLTVTLQRARLVGSSAFVQLRYAAVLTWVNGLVQRFVTYGAEIDDARAEAKRLAKERA